MIEIKRNFRTKTVGNTAFYPGCSGATSGGQNNRPGADRQILAGTILDDQCRRTDHADNRLAATELGKIEKLGIRCSLR